MPRVWAHFDFRKTKSYENNNKKDINKSIYIIVEGANKEQQNEFNNKCDLLPNNLITAIKSRNWRFEIASPNQITMRIGQLYTKRGAYKENLLGVTIYGFSKNYRTVF